MATALAAAGRRLVGSTSSGGGGGVGQRIALGLRRRPSSMPSGGGAARSLASTGGAARVRWFGLGCFCTMVETPLRPPNRSIDPIHPRPGRLLNLFQTRPPPPQSKQPPHPSLEVSPEVKKRNRLVALACVAFAFSVYSYSIRKLKEVGGRLLD